MTEKITPSSPTLKRIEISNADFIAACRASQLGSAIDPHTKAHYVHYPTLDFRMAVPNLWILARDDSSKPIPPWKIVLKPRKDWSNCQNLLTKNLGFIRARDERIFFGLWNSEARVFTLVDPPYASHLLLIAHQYHGGSQDFWNIKPLEASVYQNSLANWQIDCITNSVGQTIQHRYDILLCELAPHAYPQVLRYQYELYQLLGEQVSV